MTFRSLNENKKIILIANGLLIFTTLLILGILSTLYKYSAFLDNPLLAQEQFFEISQKQITSGVFSTIGLLIMVILKSFKQNFFIVIMGVLTVFIYYCKLNGLP